MNSLTYELETERIENSLKLQEQKLGAEKERKRLEDDWAMMKNRCEKMNRSNKETNDQISNLLEKLDEQKMVHRREIEALEAEKMMAMKKSIKSDSKNSRQGEPEVIEIDDQINIHEMVSARQHRLEECKNSFLSMGVRDDQGSQILDEYDIKKQQMHHVANPFDHDEQGIIRQSFVSEFSQQSIG